MFRDLATLMNSPLRIKALAYILKRPNEEGTAQELASAAGTTREAALRELNALVRLSMVRARGTVRDRKFVPEENDLLYEPIRNLLISATTPDKKDILNAFRGVRGLRLIVTAGALMDDPRSGVDLLVVSRSRSDAAIAKAVKKVEAIAAIPIRYAVLGVEEYEGRKQAYDRMLRDIFEYSHEVVLEKSD